MKSLFHFFGLLCMIFLSYGCSQMSDDLYKAEQLLDNSPDSTLFILRNISYTKLSDPNKALYGLLYTQAYDQQKLVLSSDSLLKFSTTFYEKESDLNRLAVCYFYQGRLLRYSMVYDKAMYYYLKALEITLSTKNNLLLRGKIYFDMAIIHNTQRDYELARNKFKLSHSCFVREKSVSLANYSLIYIGRSYLEQKRYATAISFYKDILKTTRDSVEYGLLIQEIGVGYYQSGNLDSSLIYLRQAMLYPYREYGRAYLMQTMADVFYDLDQIDSARIYAGKALELTPDIRVCKNCYRILTNCASDRNDLKAVKRFMEKYQDCSDSIRAIDVQTKGSYIETMYNSKVQADKANAKVIYLTLFVLILILSSVGIYLWWHRKNIREKKLAFEKQQQQQIDLRLEVIERTRAALHKRIDEKRCEPLGTKTKHVAEDRQQKIVRMYAELIHFNDQKFFYQQMDSILNNLASKLRSEYPALNEKELQWACLSLLKIPNNDILYLLDYNADSLKKMKQRFAKKVDVGLVSRIDDFLMDLITK